MIDVSKPHRFTEMQVKTWKDLTFGISSHPLKYGLNLEVGSGEVIPEIKYFPRREKDNPESIKKEYSEITENILKRAVDLGLNSIQLETEQTFQITKEPKLGGEITCIQKSIMEEYAEEYNLRCALRVTVADIREFEGDMRNGDEISLMLESFDEAARNGADVLSIESIGGKEVFNYAVLRQDINGVLFSVGVLGSLDMEFLWREIVNVASKHKVIAGGDTDCAHSNTAMILAGGLHNKIISHVFAAVVRAIGAARSLVAYEEGATGPGKDCGYENIIVKAITGFPMSMEGKTSASAHSSLVGNVAAAACDLWSNEQVENVKLYGGWAPQVFTEILSYDTMLMNEALKGGFEHELKDLLVEANPLDPQVLVLTPKGAWEIGEAIIRYPDDYYLRAREAALSSLKVIEQGYREKRANLPQNEERILAKIRGNLESMPDSTEKFIEKNIANFTGKVKSFISRNYNL